jgi:hypothetical protein
MNNLTTRSLRVARDAENTENNGVAHKYSEAPKMLNQASMLQHFLSLTASNGSPLEVLLRRYCARAGCSEQRGQGVHGERPRSRMTHTDVRSTFSFAFQFLPAQPAAALSASLRSALSSYADRATFFDEINPPSLDYGGAS